MGVSEKIQIAIMWPDLGSYHKARLNAAVRLLPEADITAIETVGGFGSDEGLSLRITDIATCVTKTMFPAADYGQLSPNAIRQKTQEILDELRPDVLAVCGYAFLEAKQAVLWCRRAKIPCILMSASTQHASQRCFWKEWLKSRLVRCFSAALVGGRAQNDYVVRLGMPPDRVFTGYDAVDNDYFWCRAEVVRASEREYRAQYDLPAKYFLCSNRFAAVKNLFRLLDAYGEYRRCVTDPWDLVLVGDGALMERVKQTVRDLDLEHHVILPGFRHYSELPVYYGLAGCLILASMSETWGLVVNEAMASGLPVLVSKACGCCGDLVREGENGFSFDPFDVDEMAQKMRAISHGDGDLARMGQRSKEIIAEWGPERFAQGLKAAAEKALDIGPKKVPALDRLFLKALMLKR